MNILTRNDLVNESSDAGIISYTIHDEYLFNKIGYKALQSQELTGLIKCFEISHNEKIKFK